MINIFAGCEYILPLNKIKLPDGTLVDRKRFNVIYGGHTFKSSDGQVTTSAWLAFTRFKD